MAYLDTLTVEENAQKTELIMASDKENKTTEVTDKNYIAKRVISTSLSIKKNCYYWKSKDKQGNDIEYAISNFIIFPKYLLKHNRNAKRIIRIVNENKQEAIIAMQVKSMVSLNELAAIVEGEGNFVPDWNKKQFTNIKKDLYANEEQAEEIDILGYQPESNFFAFANGIYDGEKFHLVDEYGVVTPKEITYYIPALSKINEDAGAEFLHEQKFIYKATKTGFKDWNKLILNVYQENGMISVAFAIATVFRDIVFRQTNFFPLLFLFGKPQSGKSTLRTSMQCLFGEPQKEISLEGASSPKGFSRKLGQFRNGLISFEEYKNNINKNLIGMLKNTYDGIGYERAQMTNDNKTHSSPVHSAVIVAGQEMPTQENALFTRVLLLEFVKQNFDNAADFERLKAIQQKGLGNVLLEILACRKQVWSKFNHTYQSIYKELKYDSNLKGISDRSIKNVVAILTPIKILSETLEFAFSYQDLFAVFKAKMKEQYEIMARTNEVNQFFQIFDLLKNEPRVQIDHLYVIANKMLYIRYNEVYAKYREYGLKANHQILGKESMLRYLKNHSSFVKPKKGNRDSHTQRFTVFELGEGAAKVGKKCYGFDMNLIQVYQEENGEEKELNKKNIFSGNEEENK